MGPKKTFTEWKWKSKELYDIWSEDERELDRAELEQEHMNHNEDDDEGYAEGQRRCFEKEENRELRFRKRWAAWDASRVIKK
jgi:hypothetical protein